MIRAAAQGPAYLFAQRFLWECLTSRTIDQFPIPATSHDGKRHRRKVRRHTATAAVQHVTRECSDHGGQFGQEHVNCAASVRPGMRSAWMEQRPIQLLPTTVVSPPAQYATRSEE